MTGKDIRASYLSFFSDKVRQHAVIPPARLIPDNDPTTLFTSSGMQPLVPYLKGQPHSMGTRLVDSQPSFRAEDIEEVGDNRHTTFFEMLGNWSLGDYFKKEQLPWVFEFVTKVVGLDPNRIYVTVFEGNDIIPRDTESIGIWQKLFGTNEPAALGANHFDPKTKIYMYPAKKNWWSRAGVPENMPVGEIGGPDSELFFDFGEELKLHEVSPWKDEPCHVNCDCGRFMEIGNSVFMQYIKTDKGFEPLPKQNVDFGGGLERIAAASNNNPDMFLSDLLYPLIKQVSVLTGKPYDETNAGPMRIIADHIRASVRMISEGIEPSNKLQGYILRRLIRRSVLKLQQLGHTASTTECMKALGETTSNIYSLENFDDTNLIQEAEKFERALTKGIREFEKYEVVTGKVAFDLLQSFGFPWELSLELALEKGQKIDRAEFETEFKKHQELSRGAAKGLFKGGLADHSEVIVKYHTTTHLLHASLRKVLGSHVQQMGSNITAERLRFDFKHAVKVTQAELSEVEALMNQKIAENLPVHKTIEDKDEALKSGAMAFFRDKYPDKVSVYTIGQDIKSGWFSKELCGGPHVSSTGSIGPVTIKKEEAVGAGVRRVYITLNQSYGSTQSTEQAEIKH